MNTNHESNHQSIAHVPFFDDGDVGWVELESLRGALCDVFARGDEGFVGGALLVTATVFPVCCLVLCVVLGLEDGMTFS